MEDVREAGVWAAGEAAGGLQTINIICKWRERYWVIMDTLIRTDHRSDVPTGAKVRVGRQYANDQVRHTWDAADGPHFTQGRRREGTDEGGGDVS